MNGYFLLYEVYSNVFIECSVFILRNRISNQGNNVFVINPITDDYHFQSVDFVHRKVSVVSTVM